MPTDDVRLTRLGTVRCKEMRPRMCVKERISNEVDRKLSRSFQYVERTGE